MPAWGSSHWESDKGLTSALRKSPQVKTEDLRSDSEETVPSARRETTLKTPAEKPSLRQRGSREPGLWAWLPPGSPSSSAKQHVTPGGF